MASSTASVEVDSSGARVVVVPRNKDSKISKDVGSAVVDSSVAGGVVVSKGASVVALRREINTASGLGVVISPSSGATVASVVISAVEVVVSGATVVGGTSDLVMLRSREIRLGRSVGADGDDVAPSGVAAVVVSSAEEAAVVVSPGDAPVNSDKICSIDTVSGETGASGVTGVVGVRRPCNKAIKFGVVVGSSVASSDALPVVATSASVVVSTATGETVVVGVKRLCKSASNSGDTVGPSVDSSDALSVVVVSAFTGMTVVVGVKRLCKSASASGVTSGSAVASLVIPAIVGLAVSVVLSPVSVVAVAVDARMLCKMDNKLGVVACCSSSPDAASGAAESFSVAV